MTEASSGPMRAVVCGYGEIGWSALGTLLELGVDVPLVVTHEDAPGEKIWFHSVRALAETAGVPVIAPDDVNDEESVARIARARPDFLFSFYFRSLLGAPLLALPRRGALNLHGSLLPRYRGRAPVNWVLVHGEKETGVTLHYMDERADHGDVVAWEPVAIERDDCARSLTLKLALAADALLRREVPRLAAGCAARIPQDHGRATRFGGRRPRDGAIDWRLSAEQIRNLVRAVTDPWPGAFGWLRSRKLMVWWAETAASNGATAPGEIRVEADGLPRVATGDGALRITRMSWEGDPPDEASLFAKRECLRSGERCQVMGVVE